MSILTKEINPMNFSDIKDSQEEMESAIRRHNEQVTKQISEQVFGAEQRGATAMANYSVEIAVGLDAIIARQRQQILLALEALQRGNTDDAKRILEHAT